MDATDHPPFLELRSAGAKGLGVFTRCMLSPGQRVLRFQGPVLSLAEVESFTHVIQVGAGVFLGPSGGIDDYINHSCEPNCALEECTRGLGLVALKRVRQGEEITFDYSTCIVDEPALPHCHCGSSRCRGSILAFTSLGPRIRRRYERLGAVPGFALAAAGEPAGRRRPAGASRIGRPGPERS